MSETLEVASWPPSLTADVQRQNVASAVGALVCTGLLRPEQCLSTLGRYSGLPHRQESLGCWKGRTFVNDSKATTPQSAMAAIRSWAPTSGRLLLLAGGADKQVDLEPFAASIAEHVSLVALLGATGPHLLRLIARYETSSGPQRPPVQACCCPSLAAGFEWLMTQSQPDDTILLSPGCASFGEFVNFEARGAAFRRVVADWAGRESADD